MSRVTTTFGRSADIAFKNRNTRSFPIRGELTDDVVYIPASVDRGWQLTDLLRKYPPGSAVVAFSAPTYPGIRSAVIAYRYFWHGMGCARLERLAGGWAVATNSSSLE
jgi:hypothetical protein